jgi:hypothetical protein
MEDRRGPATSLLWPSSAIERARKELSQDISCLVKYDIVTSRSQPEWFFKIFEGLDTLEFSERLVALPSLHGLDNNVLENLSIKLSIEICSECRYHVEPQFHWVIERVRAALWISLERRDPISRKLLEDAGAVAQRMRRITGWAEHMVGGQLEGVCQRALFPPYDPSEVVRTVNLWTAASDSFVNMGADRIGCKDRRGDHRAVRWSRGDVAYSEYAWRVEPEKRLVSGYLTALESVAR